LIGQLFKSYQQTGIKLLMQETRASLSVLMPES